MNQEFLVKPTSELILDAKAGNPQAQDALAMLNELGLIAGASLSEALHWYGQAATKNPLAALHAGNLLERGGPNIAMDKTAADAFFRQAEQGGYRSQKKRLAEVGIKSKQTILLVDDSNSARKITRAILESSGFNVLEASDGRQAMILLRAGQDVDLILSDVEMPNLDGPEMLQQIRQQLKLLSLPVIMITGVRDVGVLKKTKLLGLQGWVLKPFEKDALLQMIHKNLANA